MVPFRENDAAVQRADHGLSISYSLMDAVHDLVTWHGRLPHQTLPFLQEALALREIAVRDGNPTWNLDLGMFVLECYHATTPETYQLARKATGLAEKRVQGVDPKSKTPDANNRWGDLGVSYAYLADFHIGYRNGVRECRQWLERGLALSLRRQGPNSDTPIDPQAVRETWPQEGWWRAEWSELRPGPLPGEDAEPLPTESIQPEPTMPRPVQPGPTTPRAQLSEEQATASLERLGAEFTGTPPRVHGMTLSNPQLRAADLAPIRALDSPTWMILSDTPVTDAGLQYLSGLKKLRRLTASNTQITDAGLVHLKDLKELRILHLDGNPISDEGLVHLYGLVNLETLVLTKTRVTAAGVRKLKQAVPNVDVIGVPLAGPGAEPAVPDRTEGRPGEVQAEPRLAVAEEPAVIDLSEAAEAWARNWSVVSTSEAWPGGKAGFYGPAMRVGDANPSPGREGILILHPVEIDKPARIARRVRLPDGSPKLRLGVCANRDMEGDWALRVKVDGRPLEEDRIIRGREGWQDLTFDLARYAGQAVRIEIEAHANNWFYEHAFFDFIEIPEDVETTKQTAPQPADRHPSRPASSMPDPNEAIRALKRVGAKIDSFQGGVWAVNLTHTRVTDADMVHVSALTGLASLDLSYTRITDEGLAHLEELTTLEDLALSGTRVTDNGLAHLRNLTRLESLWLSNTQVGNAGLAHLRNLTRLDSLWLSGTQVGDAGLPHLVEMKRLSILMLSGTQISDVGLKHLEGLQNLKTLDAEDTNVTIEGAKRLKAALPDCAIGVAGRLIE